MRNRCVLFVSLLLVTTPDVLAISQSSGAVGRQRAPGPNKLTIRQAQKKLIELGYQPGIINGVLGTKTIAAVKEFQEDGELPVTGKLDAATLKELFRTDSEPRSARTDPRQESKIVAENAFQGAKANPDREPTEAEMKEALIRTMQIRGGTRKSGDVVASENAIAGMAFEIQEFEKLGCKPSNRGAGYYCDYRYKANQSAYSNEGTGAGATHAKAVNRLLSLLMGGTTTRGGVATRKFVFSKEGWVVVEE